MKQYAAPLLFGIMVMAVNAIAAGELQWYSLKAGLEKARAEKKPVIVDFFFGKGCSRCEFLEKEVYGNPGIAKKIMEDFVPIRVDLAGSLTPDEAKLGEQYDYKKDCLLLFLDADKNLIKDHNGKKLCFVDKIDSEEFIRYLDTIKSNSAR